MKYKAIRTDTDIVTSEDTRLGEAVVQPSPQGFPPPSKDKLYKGNRSPSTVSAQADFSSEISTKVTN